MKAAFAAALLAFSLLAAPVAHAQDEATPWADRVSMSGLIEVDLGFAGGNIAGGDKKSDITATTVEMDFSAEINDMVTGDIVLLYEEDYIDPVNIDEAFITIGGNDKIRQFVKAGLMYPPFGKFPSAMISDPMTLTLGETRQSAIAIGCKRDVSEVSVTVFNGDIAKAGDEGNTIKNFVVSAELRTSEGMVEDGSVEGGISIISNIADTYILEDEVVAGVVENNVPGASIYISAEKGSFSASAEYLWATKQFNAGELSFATEEAKPSAMFVELGYAITEDLGVVARYQKSKDLFGFMPETSMGATVSYGLFDSTTVSAEYQHADYEDDSSDDTFLVELAIEF